MGFIDKLKGAFNPDMESDMYDQDYENDGFDYDDEPQENGTQNFGYTQGGVSRNQSVGGMGLDSGALELKVVKPEKYDSATAQKIADHLLHRRTVVLNLESTNKESARRLIDFLSGVAYSIEGYIQRVANNTFVIVPSNVDVSGEQLQEVKKQEETDIF